MSNRLHYFHGHKQGLSHPLKAHTSRTLLEISLRFYTEFGEEVGSRGIIPLGMCNNNGQVAWTVYTTEHDDLPETNVRENQAPKATEAIPPMALTRKT